MGSIGLGALAVTAQLIHRRQPLAALGALGLGAGNMVTLHKSHSAAVFARQASRVERRSPDSRPSDSIPATNRMDQIRPYAPNPSATRQRGRQAAAVADNAKRPYNLFAATQGLGDVQVRAEQGDLRSLAVIATDALREALSASFAVYPLRPQLSQAQLEHASPSVVVIDRTALLHGQWGGALSATGGALLAEVLQICQWCERHGVTTFLVGSGEGNHLGDAALFAAVAHHLEVDADPRADASSWGGALPQIVQILADHLGGATNATEQVG